MTQKLGDVPDVLADEPDLLHAEAAGVPGPALPGRYAAVPQVQELQRGADLRRGDVLLQVQVRLGRHIRQPGARAVQVLRRLPQVCTVSPQDTGLQAAEVKVI